MPPSLFAEPQSYCGLLRLSGHRSATAIEAGQITRVSGQAGVRASADDELDYLFGERPPPPPPAPEQRPAREYTTVTLREVERWKEQRER